MSDAPIWWLTLDGDRDCLELFGARKFLMGGGEKLLLRTREGDAALGWRKVTDGKGQERVNCAVFRNESHYESAELIRQADSIAYFAWPDCRHYTTIDTAEVATIDHGLYFSEAGWKNISIGKARLLTFEHSPAAKPAQVERHAHDKDVRRMKGEGMTNLAISHSLGVHKWIVDDACKRLNLVKKNELRESPIKYNKRPLVEKTCPSCRRKHMSDPAIWTCGDCKDQQDRENTAAMGNWY